MKKLLKSIVFGSFLAVGIGSMGVQAAALEDFGGSLPESLTTYVEDVTNPEKMTINGISYENLQSTSDMRFQDAMISNPEPAGVDFVWPYDYTVDYKRFTDLLAEGSDNDGNVDFLIDPYSSEGVEVMPVTIINESGEEQQVTALAYKFFDLDLGYASLISMNDAREFLDEAFWNNYILYSCGAALSIEDAAVKNPDIFWLSGEVYFTVPSITEETEVCWSGLRDAQEYCVTYRADLYCVLAIPEIGYDIRHELYRHATPIKEAIYEMNTIVEQVASEADGMDEASKARYFNNWLTVHNELNTTYTTEEQLAELFEKNPDSMNCLSALRGGTGEYAPTAHAYASAFKALCDAGHVTCNIIPGKAGTGTNKKPHAWNEVKLYETYYAVDTAWNDLTDKTNVANSGDETEHYLLVGGNTSLPFGNENLTFWASHSVKKNSEMVDGYKFKYSYLGGNAYDVKKNVKLQIMTTDNYIVAGYESLPTFTVKVKYANGTGDSVSGWQVYRVEDNGYTHLCGSGGDTYNNSTSFTFPVEYAQPGTYSVRATYFAATTKISADIRIKIVRFDDVKDGDWFKDSVAWAIHNDITAGYTFTTFAPHVNCTRGQLVTFLWRFFDCPKSETGTSDFKDITPNAYYYDAVLWAYEHGYVKGYTEDTFAPDAKVTRAELATILWRVAGEPVKEVLPDEEGKESIDGDGNETSESGDNENIEDGNKETTEDEDNEETKDTLGFKDVDENTWYYHAVYWAADNNITKGYSEDVFAPNATATRAEIVTFLFRAKYIL